jgi:hypothetical protein
MKHPGVYRGLRSAPRCTVRATHPAARRIYDLEKINSLLAQAGRTAANPEFYPTPSCTFYNQDPMVKVGRMQGQGTVM